MRAKLSVIAVALLLVGATFRAGAMSVFTGTASAGANSFTAGTVVISTAPASAIVTYSNMAPGDSVTQSVVVSNTGTLDLRYAISSTATNTDTKSLKDQLTLTIKTIDVTTPGVPCDNFDGTQLYTGDLDSTAGKLVGDSTQGSQTGDRTLTAAASETLCFKVMLPLASANTYQGATTTATFTFDAEQTKNN